MPKFSANLTMMFNEVPFLERFGAAARAGFRGVEYVSPYEHPKEVVAALLKEHGLTQALFNLPAGDWNAGERGMACIPGREEEFRASVATAIDYALALNCRTVNCLSGIKPAGAADADMRATIIGNLRYAAAEMKKAGVLLIAEPINFYDMPGFFLNTSKQALSIFDEVGSDNLKLQYDIYHMQRMEGEIAATIERLLSRIGHFQIAANPGRHEPDYGEINYPWLYQFIDGLGYTGWIGAEYKPRGRTEDGLGWLKAAQGA